MKQAEKERLIADVSKKIKKVGIPINVRTGGNDVAAEWVATILDKCVEIDEPMGVESRRDYDYCPACGSVVGQSAFYCKHCGAYLRIATW